MNNLVNTLNQEGRYADAERLGRETLAIRARVLGPEHPSTMMSLANLATSVLHQGRYTEAEKLLRQVLEVQRRVRGPDHPDTASTLYSLAIVEERQGQRDAALRDLQAAIRGLSPGDALEMETDPDLKSLHGDPGFVALVQEVKQRTATAVATPR